MSNVTVQARVTPELKKQAETIFADMGMTTAEAIRIFLKQVVNSGGLPFQPTTKRQQDAERPDLHSTRSVERGV